MDTLPLELKERICSFLSPKHLKSLRLATTQFAHAAVPYLIPRLFLFNHPDSCKEVDEILKHPRFSKYVTTLVFDPSRLKEYQDFQTWTQDRADEEELPFPPDARRLRAFRRAKSQYEKYTAEYRKILEETFGEEWQAYQHVSELQTSGTMRMLLLEALGRASTTCPKLSNLVISSEHYRYVEDKRRLIYDPIELESVTLMKPIQPNMLEFSLSDVLDRVHRAGRSLHSLTLMATQLLDYSPSTHTDASKDLKHVRVSFEGSRRVWWHCCGEEPESDFNMSDMFRAMESVETIRMDMPFWGSDVDKVDMNKVFTSINSSKLRDCVLENLGFSEDILVDFLLRHNSLEHFGVHDVQLEVGSWKSMADRVSCQLPSLQRVWLVSLSEPRLIPYRNRYRYPFIDYCERLAEMLIDSINRPSSVPDERFHRAPQLCRGYKGNKKPEIGLWSDYDRIADSIWELDFEDEDMCKYGDW